jgi:hypothetical protein
LFSNIDESPAENGAAESKTGNILAKASDLAAATTVGAKVGALAVATGFVLIGLSPAGPVAAGWFAANSGAGIAAGSAMAMLQSLAMTSIAYTTGAAIGGTAGAAVGAKTGGNMTYFVIDKYRSIVHYFNGTLLDEEKAKYFPNPENVTDEDFHRFLVAFPQNFTHSSFSSDQSSFCFISSVLKVFNSTSFPTMGFTPLHFEEKTVEEAIDKICEASDFLHKTASATKKRVKKGLSSFFQVLSSYFHED